MLTAKQVEARDTLLAGPATHQLLAGGSRSGKTFLFVRAVCMRALKAKKSRHAILRLRFNHLKAAIVHDTFPKAMTECFPNVKYKLDRTDWFAEFPNDSQVWFGGLDDKDRTEKILGSEFATIFLNESSQIPYASRNIALTRLAQQVEQEVDGRKKPLKPRMYYDENPPSKAHWTYELFVNKRDPETKKALKNPDDYGWMRLNPEDNLQNISENYLETLRGMPERHRKRFMLGEFSDATPNALWTEELIEKCRVDSHPDLQRIVVAADPSGSGDEDNASNDEVGVIVAGLGTDGIGYVLEDCTLKAGPATWGERVVDAFDRHDADCVVGETNYGGDMVSFVVETAETKRDGRNPPFKKLTASRGKVVRAEPISALFDAGKVKLVGEFRELENELCAFSTNGYMGEGSPDRADACIWALSELFPGMVRKRYDEDPVVVMSSHHKGMPYCGGVIVNMRGQPLSRTWRR